MTHLAHRFSLPVMVAMLLSSCSTEQGLIPPPLEMHKQAESNTRTNVLVQKSTPASTQISANTPKPPAPSTLSTIKESPAPVPDNGEKADITLMFDQLPLPSFIQVVYGSILKSNFNVDAQVAARTDLVTLRTAKPQTPSQVKETAQMLLKSYGIAVTDVGGFLRIVPDNTLQGYAPEIRRGRALPETPLPLRPVFQLVELDAVMTGEVAPWLTKMYGAKLNLEEDGSRNALMISGQSDDVTSAIETIHVLDQPRMRGQHSTRIDPMFWSAQEMTNKLNEIMAAEGYRSATTPASNQPVILMPVQAINAIIVFSSDPAIIKHIIDWAKELDKPASKGGGFFTYHARYTDAKELAATVRELLGGGLGKALPGQPAQPVQSSQSRVVVNAPTNSLIFQGGMEDYTSILNLLQELDQPAKAALIEVTVAEVNLSDAEQLGVEWQLSQAKTGGALLNAGTLGGLGIGTSGLTIQRLSSAGSPRLTLNALANNNRARILSSPRILARNGESATIQVGQEVPIITSQQTSPVGIGVAGVLQSVEYRSVGVILHVKPVIHAGDRIELEVQQEVSSAQSTTTGVSVSPTISTRKIDTKLSLKDGSTVLLGGLMSSDNVTTRTGIPLLMDIPVIGHLFSVDSVTTTKTELIVLITPYIIADDKDAEAITDAFRNRLGEWANNAALPESKPSGNANTPTTELNKERKNQPLTLQSSSSMMDANSVPAAAATPAAPVTPVTPVTPVMPAALTPP